MVPKGWQEIHLGDVVSHKKGFAFNSGSYKNQGIRIVRISDTTRNSIHSENPVYLCEQDALGLEQYILGENDILLSTVGSRPHLLDSMVGKAVKVPVDAAGSLLNQNLVKLIPKETLITNEYLYEMLKNNRFIFFISTLVRGNANQVSITLAELFKYQLVLPSLPEQKKIAQILSTWDKAISITEQLLANSQQQKKALMQQLLTGKKRLLDNNGVRFSGEWKSNHLKKLLQISKGNQLNKDTLSKSGEYAVINGGIEPSGYTSEYNTEANTITISEGGNSCGFVGFKSTRFWCGGHCYAIKNLKIDLNFTYQLLKFNQSKIMRLRVGSGLPNIQKKDLEELSVDYPISQEEQQKIAAVLTTTDKGITALQQKLDALKQEKKALMQQLLTGKRRVKV
ncbi:restriction endonuclease subunit S [Aeromonas veronii]|uniref:restriction endonuclease subunit S n=1 Tax=Aeromonas caviae TaxID=648 RepID=UPI0038EF1A96